MALTDAQVEALADDYLVGLFQTMEKDVIQDVARRVRKTGRLTETAEIMARNMHEQGFSPAKIYAEVMKTLQADPAYMAEVAQNTLEYKKMVAAEIRATVRAAQRAGDELVANAGTMTYNNDLSMWELAGQDLTPPSQMSQIVGSFQRELNGQIRNLTRTTGFKGTLLGTTGVKQAYTRALDVALVELSTGTFSFDAACNRVVKDLARSGLRTIDYASGRSYQLDTAVRMSVRTGMNQMAGRITEANCKNSGTDLVIVSQHEGARPDHVPCENQVYSLSGRSDVYPAFSAPLGEGAGYGSVDGICGANCRHTFYPYWEGISKIHTIEPKAPVEVNGKTYSYYDATQRQRSMEREIRALKREEYSAGTPEEAQEIRNQIRSKTSDYHSFSDAVGIRPKDNRLRVAA